MKTEFIVSGLFALIVFVVWVYYKISKGAKAEQVAENLKASHGKAKKLNKRLAKKDKEFEEDKKKYKKGRTATDRDVKPWWLR